MQLQYGKKYIYCDANDGCCQKIMPTIEREKRLLSHKTQTLCLVGTVIRTRHLVRCVQCTLSLAGTHSFSTGYLLACSIPPTNKGGGELGIFFFLEVQ